TAWVEFVRGGGVGAAPGADSGRRHELGADRRRRRSEAAPIGGMGRQPLTTTSELVAPRPARSVHRTSWARRYEFAAASTPLRPAPSPSRVRPRPGVGVAGCPLLQPVRVRVRAEVVLPGGVRAVPGTNSARGTNSAWVCGERWGEARAHARAYAYAHAPTRTGPTRATTKAAPWCGTACRGRVGTSTRGSQSSGT